MTRRMRLGVALFTISIFLSVSVATNIDVVRAFTTTTFIPIFFANQNVGIGTSSPYAKLAIFTSTTTDATPATGPLFQIASSTDSATTTLFQVSRSGQVQQGGSLPTLATSTGYGTGASAITIAGAPNLFTLTFTSGSAPATAATVFTVTMPSACSSALVPVISPVATTVLPVYASSTGASTLNIVSGSSAITSLIATTTYVWNVHVGCY